jgi:hypothetical protein
MAISTDQWDAEELVCIRVTYADGTSGRSGRMRRVDAERHLSSAKWLLHKTPPLTRSTNHVIQAKIIPWSEA